MKLPRVVKRLILSGLRAAPFLERRLVPSAGYRRITHDDARRLQSSAAGWKNSRSAAWQQSAYGKLLDAMSAGRPRSDFVAAAGAVDAAGIEHPRLLEVGCGGGYHSEVFAALCASNPAYAGADYSAEMVESARRRFPGVPFEVADTTALPYADDAFDIVFDGVSLMHILDFRRALGEIARVARSHVVLHCVPVFEDDHPTQYFFKYAYGEPVTEAVYGRAEFEAAIVHVGLRVERSWLAISYDLSSLTEARSHSRTYLCRIVTKS